MLELRANGTTSILLSRVVADAFVPYTIFIVALAMLLGGGTILGLWSDAIVQLASLPLLASALFKLSATQLTGSGRWGLTLLCTILALPLLQLVPLSPDVWRALPGRGEIASGYQATGMDLPWLPVSLDPAATWRGLLSLLPATAIFLAMLSLGKAARRFLIALVLAIVFVSVLLDLLQIMGGDQSLLRFYAITNYDRAVGFFANANHNAAFLYCAIPFAAGWAIGLLRDHHRNRTIGVTLLALLLAAIVIGLAVIRSRAGLTLGFVAGLCCLALVWRHDRGHLGRRLMLFGIGANLIALLIAFQFGFVGIAERVEKTDLMADIRWPVAGVTSQAALANLPFGSGFGTFVPVYEMFAPRTLLYDRYVNHAHNDWLELWLTGGVPAMVLALAFLAWFVGSSIGLWRSSLPGAPVLDIALARAASIVVVLLLLHSIVDYPLRTTGLTVLFAVACAFVIPGRRIDRPMEMTAADDRPAPSDIVPARHVLK